MPKGRPKQLRLDQIRTDGGTQVRCKLDESAVADYAEAIARGDMPDARKKVRLFVLEKVGLFPSTELHSKRFVITVVRMVAYVNNALHDVDAQASTL